MVVRGRTWSCVVVTHCRSARFAASIAVTHGRTTYNTPLNPPGVGWVNFFYPIKVRVSIRTCVPNVGSIRGSVRKNCLLSLIIDVNNLFIFLSAFTIYLSNILSCNLTVGILIIILIIMCKCFRLYAPLNGHNG